MEKLQLSVSDFVALVNQTLDYAYPSVRVVGEVSGFKVSQGKYVFFDLKDEAASVSCFMSVWQLRTALEDGMRIEVVARPKLTPWGKFSLTVSDISPIGEGSLKRAFQLLVAKLQKEGLFEPSRKRALPELPGRIGVISSTGAAGYKDFVKLLGDRWGGMEVIVANVAVQGSSSPQQITNALTYFNQLPEPPEVLVIVRGGGSVDDLAAFNDEPLARAIAASRAPTLVGVGHESDVSLADMVADVRASTPSNAAQLLVPNKREIVVGMVEAKRRVLDATERLISSNAQRLVDKRRDVVLSLARHHQTLVRQLDFKGRTLKMYNPSYALERGYALVRVSSGSLLARGSRVLKGDRLWLELQDAIIQTEVTRVDKKA